MHLLSVNTGRPRPEEYAGSPSGTTGIHKQRELLPRILPAADALHAEALRLAREYICRLNDTTKPGS